MSAIKSLHIYPRSCITNRSTVLCPFRITQRYQALFLLPPSFNWLVAQVTALLDWTTTVVGPYS